MPPLMNVTPRLEPLWLKEYSVANHISYLNHLLPFRLCDINQKKILQDDYNKKMAIALSGRVCVQKTLKDSLMYYRNNNDFN